jgi:hypothetical protein
MEKIVYIALDERPCNEKFPREIFDNKDLKVVSPSLDIMPYKTKPGNFEALKAFLLEETKDAYGLVISMDTLLYGGLVPGRIHNLEDEVIMERLEFIKELKKINKDLVVYGFQVIMRCPVENGADEEPVYYKTEGRNIYLNGYFKHKEMLGILSDEERKQWNNLNITPEYLEDFENRRRINLKYDVLSIEYTKEEIFDFLILCQDDSDEYGYPALDQEVAAKAIKENNLRLKVLAYAGADEVGMILISRMLNKIKGKQPTFYIKYPSPSTATVVPCLEDRYLDITVKYQIIAAGGIVVPSIEDADLVLVTLMGATKMFPTVMENQRDIDVLSNMIETFEFIKWAIKRKPVIVADLFFLNAGSVNVLDYIKESNVLMDLAAYAGWNTSSNALGTCIAQGIQFYYTGKTAQHNTFLIKRYIEDIGYCGIVRKSVTGKLAEYGMNYFNVKETNGIAADLVRKELYEFINTHLKDIAADFEMINVNIPWYRMFEVDFDIVLY